MVPMVPKADSLEGTIGSILADPKRVGVVMRVVALEDPEQ